MRRFAEICEAVAATSKKNEKVRLVGDYLRSLCVEDAAEAALLFTGRPFARATETTLSAGGSLIWQTVQAITGALGADMNAAYRRHGDIGGMTEDLFASQGHAREGAAVSLREFQDTMQALAAARGPSQKMPLLERLLRRAGPLEAKYMVKVITGELRIGLRESLVEEAIAHAYGRAPADVRRANMLAGDIGATLRLAAADELTNARFRLFHPVGFMLASPAETAEEAIEPFIGEGRDGAHVEDKYDGIRAQAHRSGNAVKLYSRTLDEIPEFAEVHPAIARLPGEFILDGEIVAWRDNRALPFAELQQRLGRLQPTLFMHDEVPVIFMAFDLLYLDGELLLDHPLSERRARLERVLGGDMPPAGAAASVRLAPAARLRTAGEVRDAFGKAIERGNEGVMLKAPGSPYAPGRRGQYWRKLKAPLATLDVVVVAVEWGHGKRKNVLSDYTFAVRDSERLLTIGKAYSGLTDAEIVEYTKYFLEHTIEDQGYRRTVEPAVVIEVAFNNIQRSSRHESGYALRFPRIVRLRPDKPVTEIDTLDRAREIYEKSSATADQG